MIRASNSIKSPPVFWHAYSEAPHPPPAVPKFGMNWFDFAETGTACWSTNTAREFCGALGVMKTMTALAGAAALALIPATAGVQAQGAAAAAAAKVEPRAVIADVKRIL